MDGRPSVGAESEAVSEVVATRRRDGSVWTMRLPTPVRARSLMSDERALFSSVWRDSTAHVDLDDGQLFQLSANALDLGATIKQAKGKCERTAFLERFGDALESCCEFLSRRDLASLALIERGASQLVTISDLIIDSSRRTTIASKRRRRRRIKSADVAVDSGRSLSLGGLESLDRLTIRQTVEESGREQFLDLVQSVKGILRELCLVLRDGSWFDDFTTIRFPLLEKIRVESPASNDWRDDVELDSLCFGRFLAGAVELESLYFGDSVRVDAKSLAACPWIKTLRVGALGSAGLHDAAKYSSAATAAAVAAVDAGNRHLLVGHGRRRRRSLLAEVDDDDVEDLRDLASLISSEAVSMKTCLENVCELNLSVCRMNRLSSAMLPKKLRSCRELARAGAGVVDGVRSVAQSLGTKETLRRLRLEWINPATSPLTMNRTDFWPDVSHLVVSEAASRVRVLDLRARRFSPCGGGDEGAHELARVFLDIVTPALSSSFSTLSTLILDNLVFDRPVDVVVDAAPKTLRVLSFTRTYRARSFTVAHLPSLKHLTLHNDDTSSPFRLATIETLVVEDCPKLESFVVSADSFASTTLANSASKRRGAAITLRGTFRELRSFLLVGSARSTTTTRNGPCPSTPASLLKQQLRSVDSGLLDQHCGDWRRELEERASSPLRLASYADEIYQRDYDEEARALLNWLVERQHDLLVGNGCSIDLVDADASASNKLDSLRIQRCSVRVFGSFFAVETVSELVLDEVDCDAANAVYDTLLLAKNKKLRRLELSNFSIERALEPTSSLATLALRTKAKKITLSVPSHLRQLSLGGSSLADVELDRASATECADLVVGAEKMTARSLFRILDGFSRLTSLTLCKAKSLDTDLTLNIPTVNTLKVESCPTLTFIKVQGKRLRSVDLVRCSRLTRLGIFAPFLADLHLTTCANVTDHLIDTTASSTFDSLQGVHVSGAKFVTPRFFVPFATSKNRRHISLTMQRCDPSYKAKKSKGVIHLDKTCDWLNICQNYLDTF